MDDTSQVAPSCVVPSSLVSLQASLAHATGVGHYAGSLIAFAIVGFVPIAVLRATPGSPAAGVLSAILYGVILIFCIPRTPKLIELWHKVTN